MGLKKLILLYGKFTLSTSTWKLLHLSDMES